MFRFFPGVRNGAATAAIPTVDLNGNPVTPAGASGPLQTVSLFGLDPNRPAADPTGNVAKALKDYPLPNNFLRGDGLNTAGFFWQQPGTADNNLYNGRLDHQLTQNTRLAFSTQFERGNQLNGFHRPGLSAAAHRRRHPAHGLLLAHGDHYHPPEPAE